MKLYSCLIFCLGMFFVTVSLKGQELCNCNDTIQKFQTNKTSKNTALKNFAPYEDVIKDLDYMFVHGYDFYNKSYARKLTFIVSDHSNETFVSVRSTTS